MTKEKVFLIFIFILIIGIGIIQYLILNSNKTDVDSSSGQVKSAEIDLSKQTIEEFSTQEIKIPPQKIKDFRPAYIAAKNYILIDAETAYPLVQKDPYIAVPIASTTKIMSAIVALENYNLNDIVEISSNAARQIGSEIMLRTGEKLSVESLLYALLIQSGNDAAMALAEHFPQRGLEGFVAEMNRKAQYLQLKGTEFKDPAGLDDAGRSTAFDLAVLTSYAFKNPTFRKIVKIPEFTITSVDGKFAHQLENSNRLVKGDEPLYYPYALGVKTGFTPEAGHCLVAVAEKDNRRLVSVILNTYENTVEASAKESRKLLEWGFNNFIH